MGTCVYPSPEGTKGGGAYQTPETAAAVGEGPSDGAGVTGERCSHCQAWSAGGAGEPTPDLSPPALGLQDPTENGSPGGSRALSVLPLQVSLLGTEQGRWVKVNL